MGPLEEYSSDCVCFLTSNPESKAVEGLAQRARPHPPLLHSELCTSSNPACAGPGLAGSRDTGVVHTELVRDSISVIPRPFFFGPRTLSQSPRFLHNFTAPSGTSWQR